MGEGSREQAGGIQGLHQVVADRGQQAGFRLVGGFRQALGFTQCLVECREFLGALTDPLLQAFVGILEGLLGLTEGGDVGEAHDEAAAGHRVADQLDDPAVGELALGGVGVALAHPVQALVHLGLRIAVAKQAAVGIEADDVANRSANAHQAFGVIEQLQVAVVPGHQT